MTRCSSGVIPVNSPLLCILTWLCNTVLELMFMCFALTQIHYTQLTTPPPTHSSVTVLLPFNDKLLRWRSLAQQLKSNHACPVSTEAWQHIQRGLRSHGRDLDHLDQSESEEQCFLII